MTEPTSTCRVPLLDHADEPAASILAKMSERGPAPNLYRALANAPEILKAWTDLAWPLRRSSAPRGLRELLVAYLATRRGSDYVRVHHSRFARRHGITGEQLATLHPDGCAGGEAFSELQQVGLDLVDEVVTGGAASEETFRRLQTLLGVKQAVEVLVTVAFYEAVCIVNRSLAVPLEQMAEGGDG